MGCSICKTGQNKPNVLLKGTQSSNGAPQRTFRSLYAVGEVLGTGGFSVVRKCIERKTKDVYAVKIVSRDHLDEETEKTFREEVRILKMMDSPYIIKCYDFFEEEHFFYMVEEFVEGGELFDRIAAKHVYNENEARDLVVLLLKAVKYCHDRNIVHRDLKPENLLMAHKGDDANIKLADFGFAALTHGADLDKECGTLDYCAPEILCHVTYGKAVDMWSIGVITFILLGGYPPFYDRYDSIAVKKIQMCDYSFDDEHWSLVSDEAKDLIRHLLQVKPEDRYDVDTALKHSWITRSKKDLLGRSLHGALPVIKKVKDQLNASRHDPPPAQKNKSSLGRSLHGAPAALPKQIVGKDKLSSTVHGGQSSKQSAKSSLGKSTHGAN